MFTSVIDYFIHKFLIHNSYFYPVKNIFHFEKKTNKNSMAIEFPVSVLYEDFLLGWPSDFLHHF